MATVIAGHAPPRSNELKRFFYVFAALLVCAIVATGFGPRLYAVLVLGESRPWIIHVHGAVYVGWLVLLVAQGVLAARGRLALELLLWYAPVAVAIGYDLYARRRIHPVYLIGVVVMAAGLLRIPFGQSETWLPVGRALLRPLI